MSDLIADGGDREEEGGPHGHGQGEGAAPEGDLVDPEVRGVRVRQELLVLHGGHQWYVETENIELLQLKALGVPDPPI